MADTRKDKRAPVSLKVRFKSATVDEFIEHYCRDVSRGGIFIKSSQPMAIGTLLKFQLQLKDESSLIKGVGRVVWTRAEDDANSEAPAGMGIKFIKMDGESRAVVERIVGAQGGEPGAYDHGDPPTGASDAPPAAGSGGGSFFPDLPPAVLPPPEDRTAVRHAAQFLASALSEGGTDQAASREAEQKAEEARRRTAQIEAQRLAEAEVQKQTQASSEGLPSMIIDPSLSMPPAVAGAAEDDRPTYSDPRRAPASERPTAHKEKPKPQPKASVEEFNGEDTSITERRKSDVATLTGAAAVAAAPKKSNALPILVIVAVVAFAAVLALQGDEKPEPSEPATITPVAVEPSAPEPAPEPAAAPVPAPVPSPVVAPTPEPVPVAVVEPVAMVSLKVSTVPEGAEIFVDEESRGKAPLTLELPEGKVVILRAKSAGRGEASQEITVNGKLKPVKLSLLPLPYVLHVETTPPGAVVFVGSKRGTTPVDLELGGAPKGPLTVTVRLPGHENGSAVVAVTTFLESDQAMRSSVSLTLTASKSGSAPAVEPRPVASKPRPVKKPVEAAPKPVEVAPKPVEAASKPVEAAPKPVEAAPKPTPKPRSKPSVKPGPEPSAEPIPDNPFG